ncbi:MAG: Rne/Rng family ribonuclease [Pseudomonadota bacterium]
MSVELIINANLQETRVALLENGVLAELYIEHRTEAGISGNIYKGKVVRVLPGMQAAFIDIGLDKAAFLYVSDVCSDMEEFEEMLHIPNGEAEIDLENGLWTAISRPLQIEDLLFEGQEILVQVTKEPIGSKGARVSSHISLPGRYLVLMPTVDHVGVSRRIENEKERTRLREIVQRNRPAEFGAIVRTASEGKNENDLNSDMDFLLKLWQNILEKKNNAPVYSLIHRDLDMIMRTIRDLFTKDVDKLVVDSTVEYQKILEFVETFMPQLRNSVELYEDDEPVLDAYGIEVEIGRALGNKVWLKSGGYIVIEETEALVAIDVNTGKYVGSRNPEDTILKTNLEAVKEIAYQLRLRNIGGIIIIDFIDMKKESSKEKVFQSLKEALKKDRARTNILKISELGLIEMTRKRTRDNLSGVLCEPCYYCEGKGFIKSKTTVLNEVLREIKREIRETPGDSVCVFVNPEVANLLLEEERAEIEELERKSKKRIVITVKDDFHQEEFEVDRQLFNSVK